MDMKTDTTADTQVLFADDMSGDWQDHWFVDGRKAVLAPREGGLYFAAGTVTKAQDRQAYHAHHAVLWTRQQFDGDIRISFECKRVDDSDYGNVLIYIQAQGIGTAPYEKDIYAWRELRDVPAMDKYFNGMSLLSISLRNRLRCKRYPWNDLERDLSFNPLIEPMQDWHGLARDRWYRFEIEKRLHLLTFRSYDRDSGQLLTDCTWHTTQNPQQQLPRLIEKGRIGIRQMSTKQCIYRNFVVSRI